MAYTIAFSMYATKSAHATGLSVYAQALSSVSDVKTSPARSQQLPYAGEKPAKFEHLLDICGNGGSGSLCKEDNWANG
jgi:hypothetical protein